MGYNTDNYNWDDPYCRLFNPNRDQHFKVNSANGGDPAYVTVTQKDFNMPECAA